MAHLHELIAKRLKPANAARLDGIPECVIEDVLRIGIAHLALHLPFNVPPDMLDDGDWSPCEGCDNLIHPQLDGYHHAGEDADLCSACFEDAKEQADLPPPDGMEGPDEAARKVPT